MAKFERLDTGKIGLIQETEDGRIIQIGLTEKQSNMLAGILGYNKWRKSIGADGRRL